MYHGDRMTPIIGDHNLAKFIDPRVGWEERRRGLVPRNYQSHPVGGYTSIPSYKAVQFELVSESDFPGILRELNAAKALMSHQRRRGMGGRPIPSRDQDGVGYCWQHSPVSVMLMIRARDGQPYVDFSAFGPACRGKNFRDQGGWGAEGVDNLIRWGCPSSATWAQKSMNRSNDNDASRAEALLYRIDEGWIDLETPQYDRNLTWRQIQTCTARGWPWVSDHNWWGHSVGGMEVVEGKSLYEQCRDEVSHKLVSLSYFESVWDMHDSVTGGQGSRIWNSWSDEWGDMGEGILTPQKAVPDGSVAICSVTAAGVNRRISRGIAALAV